MQAKSPPEPCRQCWWPVGLPALGALVFVAVLMAAVICWVISGDSKPAA
jgi:hypothetical protein